jgi:phage protein D
VASLTDLLPTAVAKVPHPVFVLSYEQKNITSDITPYVRSVTYTDYLSGQSDELEVELEDADGRWVRNWYPGKGDTLSLKIGYEAAPLLPCGAFEIDEIEFAQPPATVSIRGLATGIKKSVRTRVGRAYENTTLAAIAQRIAKRNKLTLTGKIRDIRIDRVTQYQERDVEFLTRLAREYGYAFKIVGRKLVFTELADLRDGGTVATFKATDLIAIRLRDTAGDARRVQGVLSAATDTEATVLLDQPGPDGATERTVPYTLIDRARTVFVWGPTPKPGGPSAKSGAKQSARSGTRSEKGATR